MADITLTLTKGELDRLLLVMSYNLDVNIQKELNDAMERGSEEKVASLMAVKAKDQSLIKKLREANR